jgi:hypothetical protein
MKEHYTTMRNERELILEISRIGHASTSVAEAIHTLQALLAGEIGASVLVVRPIHRVASSLAAESISEFLDSRRFPFRGLYTAPLVVGGRELGRLIACFGSFGSPGELLRRLTAHAAQQLGELLDREHRSPAMSAALWPLTN